MYVEAEGLGEEMFAECKALAEALHLKWQGLKELWRSRRINWKRYEEGRARVEVEAWGALEGLKEKYDKAFGSLEEHVKVRFRARRP